jgi:hypothetical protein
MRLFAISKKEKEKIEGLGYEGLAIAAGEYGLAAREAEVLLPRNLGMKLMGIL